MQSTWSGTLENVYCTVQCVFYSRALVQWSMCTCTVECVHENTKGRTHNQTCPFPCTQHATQSTDKKLWERKHDQSYLINLPEINQMKVENMQKTRGNVTQLHWIQMTVKSALIRTELDTNEVNDGKISQPQETPDSESHLTFLEQQKHLSV